MSGPFRVRISAYMLSCNQRSVVRGQTLANLRLSDWGVEPQIQLDREAHQSASVRMAATVCELLRCAVLASAQFVLFLEDDLRFNRYLRHNLDWWLHTVDAGPSSHFFGTLFNSSASSFGSNVCGNTFVVDEKCAFGSQALLFSLATARHLLEHWEWHGGLHDFRMYYLASMVGPIYGHTPSLVQHVNVPSTWGGPYARAPDFSPDWKLSSNSSTLPSSRLADGVVS
jgi:hypothetical protein